MKVRLLHFRSNEDAFALVMVMFFGGLSIIVLAGVLSTSSTNSRLIDRQQQYHRSLAAAEAGTEKVLAHIVRDYYRGDEALIQGAQTFYENLYPTAAENSNWGT